MVEKPAPGTAPSNLMLPGRYILQPEVMRALDAQEAGAGGEIQLTDAMAKLIGKQPFHAYRFEGERYDCGSAAGFVIANLAMALERDDIAPAIRDYLQIALGRFPDHQLEPAALGLAGVQPVAQLADRDCALDHPGVERRIVVAQSLDRIGARNLAGNAGDQHVEVERLADDVVGAGA